MTKAFTDMMGNEVTLHYPPKRIVSLVPSQTELLYDLGLSDEVVGITKFCVHPEEWFRSKTRIGGTKTIHIDRVKELKPDLIIANKEENTKEQVDELAAMYPTWVSDIKTIDDGLHMISYVGALTGKEEEAAAIVLQIKNGFEQLPKPTKRKRIAYFIWRKPWMCAGGDTFISDVIKAAGWENAMADMARYPELNPDELKNRNIDAVLLSSEPYPFKEVHIAEIQAIVPKVKVLLVDGELFSWYGSRMKLAPAYLADLAAKI